MSRFVMVGAATVCLAGDFPLRRIARCFNCKIRRRVAGRDRGAWYGVIWTCCSCGDQWADGEALERPFRPRWRRNNITAARQTWTEAGQYSRADHRAWLNEQIRDLPTSNHAEDQS